MLKVKKLHPDAVLPKRATPTDAGYDLVAIDNGTWSENGTYIQYRTGISVELPEGFHTDIFPRSSISNTDLILANSIGLVDNSYRGEVLLRFKWLPRKSNFGNQEGMLLYKKGDRIGQLVICQTVGMDVVEVEELSSTERGTGGFGSTGK